MDNSSTVTFFSPSLNNYWGGGGGGPSPSYGPEFEKRYQFHFTPGKLCIGKDYLKQNLLKNDVVVIS